MVCRPSRHWLPKAIQDENAENELQFGDYLSAIVLIGYGLQKLTRGSALYMHLRTIKSSLQEHCHLDISTSNEGQQDEDTRDSRERDAELKAVQPQAFHVVMGMSQPQVALHESYMEWLKLMLIHFNAVNILGHYINGPQFQWATINVKILNSPSVSNDMLDWHKLFTDSKFSTIFSTAIARGSADDLSFTKEKIFRFFDDAVKSDLNNSWSRAKKIQRLWDNLQGQNSNKVCKPKDCKLITQIQL